MCPPIVDGQAVNASNSNAAWLDGQGDDFAQGKIGFKNTDVESGKWIDNTQKLQNNIAETIGLDNSGNGTAEDDTTGKTYGAPVNTINDGDNHKLALTKLADKFDNTTGHTHDGSVGNGPQIEASDLSSVPLRGYFLQGLDLTGVTGGTHDVSTEMSGKTPSSGSLVEGVVVTGTYNRVVLRNNSGDSFQDVDGDEVYGRLTESSGTWTLTFYSQVAGVETAYSFVGSNDIIWYYQELYNPMVNPPVYSELAIIPSDNPTQDVIVATTSEKGKVQLASVAPSAIAATGSAGTANATVANADHTHEGTHTVGKYGGVNNFKGDVKIEAGPNITITESIPNNSIIIESSNSGVGYQEVPAGVVNGSNTLFGPLTFTPTNEDSIAVFVDGLIVDTAEWSLVGSSIQFATAPHVGALIYLFYLTNGTVTPPPVVSGIWKTEYRSITIGEAAAKQLTLAHTPAAPSEVMLDIIGGGAQEFATDFTVASNILDWNGLGLDGVLSSGDKLRIAYVY